ncbi:MAG TPA: CYTH domain-containing protein [Candidatus Dormibacteraeota bacterium]|nr:CYTH domain-containing protein [Candidatus Dormibacteraeota bacterium]
MARNIEIKARLTDLAAARALARGCDAVPHVVEKQVDTYYALDGGQRVKVRRINGGRRELIEYQRPEASGVRASDYTITPLTDDAPPPGEPVVVVRKRREVLLIDNVRVHLDQVDGLGTFLELEAVVDAAHDDAVCRGQVDGIMAALGLRESDLIRASYAELLLAAKSAENAT